MTEACATFMVVLFSGFYSRHHGCRLGGLLLAGQARSWAAG